MRPFFGVAWRTGDLPILRQFSAAGVTAQFVVDPLLKVAQVLLRRENLRLSKKVAHFDIFVCAPIAERV